MAKKTDTIAGDLSEHPKLARETVRASQMALDAWHERIQERERISPEDAIELCKILEAASTAVSCSRLVHGLVEGEPSVVTEPPLAVRRLRSVPRRQF